MAGRAIAAFLSLERGDVALDVVLNQASPYIGEIREQVEGHPQIAVHTNLPSLALLMVQKGV